jgi:hypothetical protein
VDIIFRLCNGRRWDRLTAAATTEVHERGSFSRVKRMTFEVRLRLLDDEVKIGGRWLQKKQSVKTTEMVGNLVNRLKC